jgi:hypothetical protein
MSSKDVTQGRDQRASVRATDRILFGFRPVEPEFYERLREDFARGISLYRQEGMVEMQMFAGARAALDRLADRDHDMATVLTMIDRKLNYLLQKTAGRDDPLAGLNLHEVNMSGTGLAFSNPQAIAPGTLLEFHLVLLPDYTFVYCLGKVVESRPRDGGYMVGATFLLIHDDDRERLIQHNFRQQSLALRNRRMRQEQGEA